VKLLEQWRAGRRFIAQVGQAVWTQTPHQDGAPSRRNAVSSDFGDEMELVGSEKGAA